MGRACKLAFSYGLDSDPAIEAKFMSKLTLKKKHVHILDFVARVKPAGNSIPLKAATDAFYGIPKKSAAHRDDLAPEGRGLDPFDSDTTEEVRGTLLQWSTAAGPMGLPGICPLVSLQQEAT
jgi:hypothetical protein